MHSFIKKTKYMQLVLAMLIVILMTLLSMPVSSEAYAAEIEASGEEGNISWILDSDGSLTITGEGDMPAFTDPSSVPWHEYAEKIITIKLGQSLTSIGELAFDGCSNVISVTIPDGIASVGESAFNGCSNLKNIVFYGSKLDWSNISIGSGNDDLSAAIRYEVLFEVPVCTHIGTLPEITVKQGEKSLIEDLDFNKVTDGYEAEDGYYGGADISFTGEYSDLPGLHYDYKIQYPDLRKADQEHATCTESGTAEHWTCDRCGKIFIDQWADTEASEEDLVIPPTGHSWDDGKIITEPTCTAKGIKQYTCTVCGETKGEALPATGHSWEEKIITEPTCTAKGIKQYICTACDETKEEFIPAIGHSWGEGVITTEATCAKEGVITYTCLTCGGTKTEKISPTNDHIWKSGKIATAPTYVKDGERILTCTVCGTTKKEKISASDLHFEKGYELLKSQIDSKYDGSYTETVYQNNVNYNTTIKSAGNSLAFNFSNSYSSLYTSLSFWLYKDGSLSPIQFTQSYSGEPNCYASAYLYISASDIDARSGDTHKYTFQNKTTQPNWFLTAAELDQIANQILYSGLLSFEKSLKDDFDLRLKDIYFYNYYSSKDGIHNTVSDGDQYPTCTESGYLGRNYCSLCGAVDTEKQILPATGHDYELLAGDYDDSDYREPTCTEKGYKVYICDYCGDSYKEYIEPLGHDFSDWKVDKKATCDKEGKEIRVCSRCDKKEERSIPKTAHSFSEWSVFIDADCTEEGTETRECEYCYYEEERPIPAKGHKWDEGKITKAPTAESKGVKTYTCKECGETRTESIPKLSKSEASEQLAQDGTAIGKGASLATAEQAITSAKTDKDLKGSVFNKLRVRQSKATKTSITIKWNKVKNANKYVIFAGKSGKNNKIRKITTLKSSKTKYTLKKFNKKKLTKGTYYKFAVVALDKKGNVITSSKFAHIATLGKNKASNPAKVTVNSKVKKNKVTIKVKKTFKLKGAYASSAKKFKIKKVLPMRYESTNTKIATVTSKGVIKAKKKGTCYIYAYAQNGLYKRVKVTVKK